MFSSRILLFANLLFCLFLSFAAFSQQPAMVFQRLNISDGLSQNTVYTIYQDKKGFLWMGTGDGLNRYDGYEFRVFGSSSDRRVSFPSSVINAIAEDSRGNLIIGTSDGLSIFSPKQETVFEVLPVKGEKGTAGNHITSIKVDGRGVVWVGTLGGLKKYDPAKKALVAVHPSGARKPVSQKVYSIAQDSQGTLWAGWGKNLLRYHPKTCSWELMEDFSFQNTVRVLSNDGSRLWIATESAGLFSYSKGRILEQGAAAIKKILGKQLIRALFFDKDRVWIACRDGLYVANPALTTIEKFLYNVNNPSTISQNSLLCITKDRAGSIWIGTYSGGLSVVHPGADNFVCFKEKRGSNIGLSHKIAGNLLEDGQGNWWIATAGGGLNKYDMSTGLISRVPYNDAALTIDKSIVKSLAKDEMDNIYVGTLDGVAVCRKASSVLEPLAIKIPGSPGADQHINALSWHNRMLWAGTNGSGLIGLYPDGKQVSFVHTESDPTSIPSNVISTLLIDKIGGLWVGTNHGLAYMAPGSHRFIRLPDQKDTSVIAHSAVLSLAEDRDGRIWIGTNGKGLICFDRKRKRYQVLNRENGLVNTIVHGIKEDRHGGLWVSTNRGISRLSFKDKGKLLAAGNFSLTNYTEADGIASNGSLGQGMITREGYILFGSLDGITKFHPDRIRRNHLKPTAVFTNFLQNSQAVDIRNEHAPIKQAIHSLDHITLEHSEAFFTIVFSSLNFINPHKNTYAVQMEGLKSDDTWHYIHQKNEVTYTNLDQGEYLFKVRAANNDGIWNETPTVLKITVLPPWWKTWWAYLLYTLVIVVLLYLFYYFSISNSALKHSLAIERISHEKDNELTERKLDFFTYISHEIKTPLTLILAPLEKILQAKSGNNRIMNQLMVMKRHGDRLQRLIEQIMDYRKLDAGVTPMHVTSTDIVLFCREILLSFEQFAAEKDIRINFKSPDIPVMLWIDTEKIEKVLYNLLSNALKFTQANDLVELLITADHPEKIWITVTDTGAGIAEEHLPLLFQKYNTFHDRSVNPSGSGIGLAYSKELIDLHEGTIFVESKVADAEKRSFTRFSIELPKGKEHFDPAVVSETAEASFVESLPFEKKLFNHGADSTPVLLLVEDNPDVLNFLGNHFSPNFILYTASDGLDGWEKVLQYLPDIIVSDVMMPGMNGIELCQKIKSDERTSHIPVVLLTARTALFFKQEGLETGADDYITKPFSLALLDARIRNLLESRRLLRERYNRQTLDPAAAAFTLPDEAFLLKVVQFVDDNLQETTLNVEEMAKELAMSRMTLYRKITALTNKSPLEFIRTVRLKRAAKLLATRQYTVNEVAYKVGFSSVDYFRRSFREETGQTPTEYSENSDS